MNYLKKILPFLFLLLGFQLSPIYFHFFDTANYRLVIDMKVDKGSEMGIFINQNYYNFLQKPLELNKRKKYVFDNLTEKVEQLRIDPSGEKDAQIEIYNIYLDKNKERLAKLGPDKLAKWGSFLFTSPPSVFEDHITFSSTTNDPIILGKFDYQIPFADKLGFLIGTTKAGFSLTLTGSFLLLILVYGALKKGFIELGLFLSFAIFSIFLKFQDLLITWTKDNIKVPLNFSQSVGIASFSGAPKGVENKTFILSLLASALLGIIIYFIFKIFNKGNLSVEPSKVKQERFSIIFALIIFLLISLVNFPPIAQIYSALPTIDHARDWDSINIMMWQYDAFLGLIPFKDYWFPYGGYWNQISPFPGDLFRLHIYKTIVFLTLAYSIYSITSYRKTWCSIILSIILILVEQNYFQGFYRYAMCIAVALFYFAISSEKLKNNFPYIIFGIFSAYIFSYEQTQFIYAAVPIVLLFLKRSLVQKNYFKENISSHLLALSTFLIFFLAFILNLYLNKQLDYFINFYMNMGAMSVAVSTPSSMANWTKLSLQEESIVFIGTLFSISLSVVFFLKDLKRRKASFEGDLILLLGVLASMVFLKHLVRPFIAKQFIAIHIILILLILSRYSLSWNNIQRKISFLALGCFFGWAVQSNNFNEISSRYIKNLRQFPNNVSILFKSEQEIKTQKDTYFRTESFTSSSKDNEDIYKFFNSPEISPNNSFFVLGDDAYLYILLKKAPPPFITVYDGSPLYAQNITLKWLNKNSPEFVIWNPNSYAFDSVPNIVRVPLLYEYVINNYAPLTKVGKFQILKKSTSKNLDTFNFWKENISTTTQLGFIPSESNVAKLDKCNDTDCYNILELIPKKELLGKPLNFEFKINQIPFVVTFATSKEVENYHIFLDRLWFWNLANKLSLNIESSQNTVVFTSQQIIKHKKDANLLY